MPHRVVPRQSTPIRAVPALPHLAMRYLSMPSPVTPSPAVPSVASQRVASPRRVMPVDALPAVPNLKHSDLIAGRAVPCLAPMSLTMPTPRHHAITRRACRARSSQATPCLALPASPRRARSCCVTPILGWRFRVSPAAPGRTGPCIDQRCRSMPRQPRTAVPFACSSHHAMPAVPCRPERDRSGSCHSASNRAEPAEPRQTPRNRV